MLRIILVEMNVYLKLILKFVIFSKILRYWLTFKLSRLFLSSCFLVITKKRTF